MNDADQLEYLIGDYLDGVLDPAGEQELAERLAASADARDLLASHMRLHGAVCQLGKAGGITDTGEERVAGQIQPVATSRRRIVAVLAGIAACIAVAAGVWLQPAPPAPDRLIIAEVLEANGATRLNGEQPTDLHEGSSIFSGEIIRTTENAIISFPDGTIVSLHEPSAVTFSLDDGAKQVELHDGLLRLDVAKQLPGKPLVVRSPKANVIVLGTQLTIDVSNAHTEVLVDEGAVRMEAKDGDRTFVVIKAGEYARVSENGRISKAAQFVYWDGSAKRVHVKVCRRITHAPEKLAAMTIMPLAEAKAKGLPLCSRCPGSTTPGKRPKK